MRYSFYCGVLLVGYVDLLTLLLALDVVALLALKGLLLGDLFGQHFLE